MPKPTLELNYGAINLLKQVLSSLGWYTETSDAYRAGQLLESPEFELPRPPHDQVLSGSPEVRAEQQAAAERAALAWVRTKVSLECTEKQRETMKRCVESFMKKGGLPAGEVTNRILDQLGLAPTD